MKPTALITGGNSGIGYATASKFKDAGYEVFITGRHEDKVRAAATSLGVKYLLAELENLSDVEALGAYFLQTGLDVLVNNAGISKPIPMGSYDQQSFDHHFYTNVRAPLFLMQCLRSSLEVRKGCVTNVSSIITQRGAPGFGLYAATKGALEAFTRSIALELAPLGIRVNAVCPGPIRTPIFAKMGWTEEHAHSVETQLSAANPLGRMGDAEEVADVILAQTHASYVTGAVWSVDGGVHC